VYFSGFIQNIRKDTGHIAGCRHVTVFGVHQNRCFVNQLYESVVNSKTNVTSQCLLKDSERCSIIPMQLKNVPLNTKLRVIELRWCYDNVIKFTYVKNNFFPT
jgi:hypothetical protein